MVSLVNSHPDATRTGWHLWEDLKFACRVGCKGFGGSGHGYNRLLKQWVAKVLVGLATDTIDYSSLRWEKVLKVKKLTFTIRAPDSSWPPGLPGRLLFQTSPAPGPAASSPRPSVWSVSE